LPESDPRSKDWPHGYMFVLWRYEFLFDKKIFIGRSCPGPDPHSKCDITALFLRDRKNLPFFAGSSFSSASAGTGSALKCVFSRLPIVVMLK
jgi:hypothetical protein